MNATRSFLGDPTNWKDVQVHLSALEAVRGGWQVFVSSDGTAVIRRVSPTRREQRYKILVGEDELLTLFSACLDQDLLAIPKPARPGHPEETLIEITLVNQRGEFRKVSKWAGDAHPAFDSVLRQLFSLTTRVQEVVPFYTGPFQGPVG